MTLPTRSPCVTNCARRQDQAPADACRPPAHRAPVAASVPHQRRIAVYLPNDKKSIGAAHGALWKQNLLSADSVALRHDRL
jgi:hypothetical protein